MKMAADCEFRQEVVLRTTGKWTQSVNSGESRITPHGKMDGKCECRQSRITSHGKLDAKCEFGQGVVLRPTEKWTQSVNSDKSRITPHVFPMGKWTQSVNTGKRSYYVPWGNGRITSHGKLTQVVNSGKKSYTSHGKMDAKCKFRQEDVLRPTGKQIVPGCQSPSSFSGKTERHSHAHFNLSPAINRLKSPKTDCSNPNQDFGPIEIQIWWFRILLFLRCRGQACHCSSIKFKPQTSSKHRRADMCIRTAGTPCFGWSKHSARPKRIMHCKQ